MMIYGISLNKFDMETKEYLLERCLIRFAVKKFYGDAEPNYSELARLVFHDRSDPVTTFRSVRQGRPKPQRINIEEAGRMAAAIGMDLASLCFHVQKELEEGWTLEDDFKPEDSSPGPKSGRGKRKGHKSDSKVTPVP